MESSARVSSLSNALQDASLWEKISKSSSLAVFLDYDGTLTPIVQDPQIALLPLKTKETLLELSGRARLVIVSGRDAPDVRSLVDIPGITYVGCHGFDVIDHDGKILSSALGDQFRGTLKVAQQKLLSDLGWIPGIIIESKSHAVSVHYRKVPSQYHQELKDRFDLVASSLHELRVMRGKMILELLPNTEVNKGQAFLSLYDGPQFQTTKITPIYIGDDQTDEDAFYAIRSKGVGIIVGGSPDKKTWATYFLEDTVQVESFLRKIVQELKKKQTQKLVSL